VDCVVVPGKKPDLERQSGPFWPESRKRLRQKLVIATAIMTLKVLFIILAIFSSFNSFDDLFY
jgi:hypothetical protein